MRAGYAADDGAALHFVARELQRVVSLAAAARAPTASTPIGDEVVETPLEVGVPRARAPPSA